MASFALQLRPKHRPLTNPSFVHLFSSSTPDSNADDHTTTTTTTPPPPSPFSSYFSDVKASLKQQQQPSPPRRPPSSPSRDFPSLFSPKPSKVASLEEISKNLSEFRRRSVGPPPPIPNPSSSPSSSKHISFQELYKRNVIAKGTGESTAAAQAGEKRSFDAIRESLRQLRSTAAANQTDRGSKITDSMSLSKFKDSLKLRPENVSQGVVIGGSETLPSSVFGKELRERKEGESRTMKTEFVKMYSYGELGEKLRKLRPKAKGQSWFSLGELNERLMKLREVEEKETESRICGVWFKDLRESLVSLQTSDDEKAKKTSIQRLNILGQIGGTPNFMLAPPKEHLVEKYFHPDNMSSEEKMKLELKKVRDEFKMSESDCGSARVQVAQLTTKIKHLSSVLHKKDKHSRKGLVAMSQRRKKLLKYLRRTDWDSYCFVLSKLGLRDHPDHKH